MNFVAACSVGISVAAVILVLSYDVTTTAAHSAERSQDYKAGVCHGLRGPNSSLDPSQPIAVVLPNGTSHRCLAVDLPRGLPPVKVDLRDCVHFDCDPNAPYAIPPARKVVPE